MPTIEIVALKCETLPDLPRFENFAYIAEKQLHSHRAKFQAEFDKVKNGLWGQGLWGQALIV